MSDFITVPTVYPGRNVLNALAQGTGVSEALLGQFLNDPKGYLQALTGAAPSFQELYEAKGGLAQFRYLDDLMGKFSQDMAPFFKSLGVSDLVASGYGVKGPNANIFDQQAVERALPYYSQEHNLLQQRGLDELSRMGAMAEGTLNTRTGVLASLIRDAAAAALRPETQVRRPETTVNPFGNLSSFPKIGGGGGDDGGGGGGGGDGGSSGSGDDAFSGATAGAGGAGGTWPSLPEDGGTGGSGAGVGIDPYLDQNPYLIQMWQQYGGQY